MWLIVTQAQLNTNAQILQLSLVWLTILVQSFMLHDPSNMLVKVMLELGHLIDTEVGVKAVLVRNEGHEWWGYSGERRVQRRSEFADCGTDPTQHFRGCRSIRVFGKLMVITFKCLSHRMDQTLLHLANNCDLTESRNRTSIRR